MNFFSSGISHPEGIQVSQYVVSVVLKPSEIFLYETQYKMIRQCAKNKYHNSTYNFDRIGTNT